MSENNENSYINKIEENKIILENKDQSDKSNTNYNNKEDSLKLLSKKDLHIKINLMKGIEINDKIESISQKEKTLNNFNNIEKDVKMKLKLNSWLKKNEEEKKIENINENVNLKVKNNNYEHKISLTIKDDEIKTKNSEIIKKDIVINELNQQKEKNKSISESNKQFEENTELNTKENEKSYKEIKINNLKIKEINYNINNNNSRLTQRKKPLFFYEKPTLISLANIGAAHYMNAILQSLSQIKDLTNYFLDENISGDKIRNNNIAKENENLPQLSPVYLELLKKLWDKNNIQGFFLPFKFKETVEIIRPLFKPGPDGDTEHFIRFLLDRFHNELKTVITNNNIENNNYKVNQYDQQNSLLFSLKEISKETSIISDIFFGIEEITWKCLFCKEKYSKKGRPIPIRYNYMLFYCLIFPLREILIMKNENNIRSNINAINKDEVTLDDCFYFYEKPEIFSGENKNYCDICNQLCDGYYTSKIYSSPNVLVIILNRGKYFIGPYVKLNFKEIIDISKFVSVKEGNFVYKLTGVVISHLAGGFHLECLACCRSPIDNNWYLYKDFLVTKVENIIDYGSPDILFYKKIDSN